MRESTSFEKEKAANGIVNRVYSNDKRMSAMSLLVQCIRRQHPYINMGKFQSDGVENPARLRRILCCM